MQLLKGLQTNSCNYYREIKGIRGAAGDFCTTVTLAEVTQGKSDRQMFVHRVGETVRCLYTGKVRLLDICTQRKSDR